MFEEEDNDEINGSFNEDLERFEKSLQGGKAEFIDSDQLEIILEHYLISGQYSKALLCAERGIEQFPFNVQFFLRKAQSLSAIGQLKEALNVLSDIEKIASESFEFHIIKASIFSQLRDSKRAIKHFTEALELSEPEEKDEIYLDLAMEYENINDYKNAIRILKEALKYNVNNEAAIYEIAFCYDQIGDYEQAIQCYSDYIDENPYSYTAWYNLGNAHSKSENWDKAVWAYNYCVLINETFSPAYFNMGNAYLSMEKYQLSIENFEKCMEIDGEDGLALCYIGECYEQLANYELAKHYYQRSIEFAPELGEAWLGMGIVYDLENETKKGLTYLYKAIEIDPTNGSFYHVLASALSKLDLYNDAYDMFELAHELEPNNEELICDYVQFLLKYDELDSAETYLELSDFDESVSMVVQTLIGIVTWKRFGKEKALPILTEAIILDPEYAKEIISDYDFAINDLDILNLLPK
jgi:tetratricopeptide (TPR) repeat protein